MKQARLRGRPQAPLWVQHCLHAPTTTHLTPFARLEIAKEEAQSPHIQPERLI